MNNLIFLVVIAIALFIIGVIVGVEYKHEIDTKIAFFKRKYRENKKEVIVSGIGILFGLMVGVSITLIFPKNSIGILVDWISSVGTLGAVIVSLWLATGRKSRLKICHGQNIKKSHQKEIYFIAYNLSDISISLEFYGVKKKEDKVFKREFELIPQRVKAGEFQKQSLEVSFIKKELGIDDNYKGDIICCFAEPDGSKHCETINWQKEMLKFKKAQAKITDN